MESSASAGRVTSAVLDPRRWLALALLCGAFFVVLLDGTITIVALLSIGAGLRFSEQGLRWALSAYALTFGSLLLLGRRAADLLGRRRVFTAGAVFFTTASLLCGLAWSPAALLAARVVQGAGGPGDRPGLRDCHGRGARWGRRARGRARLGPEQHRRLADRHSVRRRHRHDRCRLRSQHYLAAHKGANPLAALTGGYQSA
jgi:hypothetical protein